MTTHNDAALLAAQLRAAVAEHGPSVGLVRTAWPDAINLALASKATTDSNGNVFIRGREFHEWLNDDFRQTRPAYFEAPASADAKPPKPDFKGMSAAQRLEAVNNPPAASRKA